ncbi:type II toxin-antitoxin system YoeB family toxin [bacterium]|nr:type II toxin-antitoxin system YoeB family toxin [bacterium]
MEPPTLKPLQGDLTGTFSRGLNYQHRIVYRIFEPTREDKFIEMWTGYIQSTRRYIINIMLNNMPLIRHYGLRRLNT